VRSRVHIREKEREDAYLDIALPMGEMEREVQSELEWFTENEACSEIALFWVISEKKMKGERSTPAHGTPTHPSIPLSVRRETRRAFSTRKINSSLKEPFQIERYAGRLAL